MSESKLPVAFVSHGGGPWPILSLDGFNEPERLSLYNYMKSISQTPKMQPKALLVISAHWEESKFTINTNPNPELLYDYYGFPPKAYDFDWPVKNDLSVVNEVKMALNIAGIGFNEDDQRDYDHGIFIPLMPAYPDAAIPVIQISLNANLSPEDHFNFGSAMAPLREKGIFIIGSGNSYHNVRSMFKPSPKAISASKEFDEWLKATLRLNADERKKAILNWENAPGARECHPREEHLIPLMVIMGAAKNDAAKISWTGTINGTSNTAFHFEG